MFVDVILHVPWRLRLAESKRDEALQLVREKRRVNAIRLYSLLGKLEVDGNKSVL